MTNYEKVKQFMEVFGQEVRKTPSFPDAHIQQLRLDLIAEESEELNAAVNQRDLVGVADALTDILYVVYGAGCAYGIDLDACFNEVHRSNMSKLGPDGAPIRRGDGKILKGPDYTPPDLRKVLDIHD